MIYIFCLFCIPNNSFRSVNVNTDNDGLVDFLSIFGRCQNGRFVARYPRRSRADLTNKFTINHVLPLSAIVDNDVVYGGVSIVVTVIGAR